MSDWDDVLTLHLRNVFSLTQALVAGMLARLHGRIIDVGSGPGLIDEAWAAPYTTSEADVNGLRRTLPVDWASEGVAVKGLRPGWVDTQMVADLRLNPQFDNGVLRPTAVHRYRVPGDLDRALLPLAGPASSYLTGRTIVVDGPAAGS